MVAIDISVDDKRVRRLFERAPGAVRLRVRQIIEASAIDTQYEMRRDAPVAVTGQLRASIRYKVAPMGLQAEVRPHADYADEVEFGRGPGPVSVAQGTPLRKWAEFRGLNPYAVQSSIERKGTRPHPFVRPTFIKMKPRVERQAKEDMKRLIGDLRDGRI